VADREPIDVLKLEEDKIYSRMVDYKGSPLDDQYQAMRVEWREIAIKRKKLQDVFEVREAKIYNDIIKKRLTKIREFGDIEITNFDFVRGQSDSFINFAKRELNEVADLLPRDWVEKLNRVKPFSIEEALDGGSSYDVLRHKMALAKKKHHVPHEFMHRVDSLRENFGEFGVRFREARRGGLPNVELSNYGENVIGFRGKFIDDYMSRVYHPLIGDTINEINSSAIEYIINNPVVLYRGDRQMFNYVIGLLAGL